MLIIKNNIVAFTYDTKQVYCYHSNKTFISLMHLWPSGLKHFNKNRKVPDSNLTRCSAGLRDPTLLRDSQ